MMRLRSMDWIFITCLLLFAAGLRIIGISYGYVNPAYVPSTHSKQMLNQQTPMQPDEYLSVAIPMNMSLRNRLNPEFFEYPAFIVNTNFVIYHLTGALDGISLADRQGENLRVYAPFTLYVFSRMYSVLGGLLLVACAYATSRIVAGRFAALAAGLLVAVSYTLVQHAHYIKPGTLSSAWMMLATWASIAALYAKNPRSRTRLYILAGIATGLAGTTRYNAAAVGLIVLLVGLILLYRHRSQAMLLSVFVSWLSIPVVFLIGSPYILLDFKEFWEGFTYIINQFTTTGTNVASYFLVDKTTGMALLLLFIGQFSLGFMAYVFVVLGIISAWTSRPKLSNLLKENSTFLYGTIIGLFVLAYVFVVLRTIRPGHSDNLLILFVPFIALLAAIGADWLYRKLPFSTWLTAPLIVILLIFQPLLLTVQLVRMFHQPDTRIILLDWVHEHIPYDSRFFLNGPYNLPLDTAFYSHDQQFGQYVEPLPDGDDYDYMIYSDVLAFDILRWRDYAPADVIAAQGDYIAQMEQQFKRVVQIERPVWTGYDSLLNMASYWHNPTLILYCLNTASCQAVGIP